MPWPFLKRRVHSGHRSHVQAEKPTHNSQASGPKGGSRTRRRSARFGHPTKASVARARATEREAGWGGHGRVDWGIKWHAGQGAVSAFFFWVQRRGKERKEAAAGRVAKLADLG